MSTSVYKRDFVEGGAPPRSGIHIAPSDIAPSEVPQPEGEESANVLDPYVAYKMGRLGPVNAGMMASTLARAASQYNFAYALRNGPNGARYAGPTDMFYLGDGGVAKAFRGAFLPRGLAGLPFTAQIDKVNHRAEMLGMASSGVMQVVFLVRLGIDVFTLINCSEDTTCNSTKVAAIALDGGSTGVRLASAATQFGALYYLNHLDEQAASKLFLASRGFVLGSVVILVVGSGVRLGVEVEHFLETGDINASMMVEESSNLLEGASNVAYHGYILREALHAGNSKEAIDILKAGLSKFPPAMNAFIKWAGVAGAILGIGISVVKIDDTVSNAHQLSESEFANRLGSGVLTLAAGGLSLVAAFLFIATAMPVALVLAATATGLIAVANNCDHMNELYKKKGRDGQRTENRNIPDRTFLTGAYLLGATPSSSLFFPMPPNGE